MKAVRFCTSNLNLSPTCPHSLALLKMDMDTKHRIELAVSDILKSADIDSVTEKDIRAMAARNLDLDLSSLPYKILVRQVIESFLLSLDADLPAAADEAEDAVERRIEAAVAEVVKSGDLSSLTMKDALSMVEDKVGVDVSVLPYEAVASQVIRCVCNSAAAVNGGGSGCIVGVAEERNQKIEVSVTEILKSDDMMCSLAIKDVLAMIGDKIGLDFSVLPHRTAPHQVISHNAAVNGKYGERGGGLVATSVNGAAEEPEETKPVVTRVAYRVICKLSNKRDVAIGGSGQNTRVAIRELIWKDGKQIPTPKSISLSNEQWSLFRKSIPAIEEAITKVESRLRSEPEGIPANDGHDRSNLEIKQNGGATSRAEAIHKESTHRRPGLVAAGKRSEVNSSAVTTPRGLVPREIIRFDGKNYLQWADRMETYLNHLQVAHVLSDPCPSAVGVTDRELGHTLSAVEKWTNDDHICRHNILNSLCDNLFGHYSKKSGTAKDLWEELKLIYLNEEHGANVSLVRKYIEFQMVEERSVFEQVQEFHYVADSINASGMYVEEKFHVNAILSKLPPSWKPYAIQLMKKDFLPVWMLMNHLKAEEESRGKGNKSEALLPRPEGPPFQSGRRIGPQRIPMKKPGVNPMNHETDREKKVRFCTHCKKKGHVLEQCWFRKSGGKDTTNENDNIGSAKTVAGANMDAIVE